MLMVLMNHADSDGLAYPRNATIGDQAGVATRKVSDAKQELEAAGWIAREGGGSPRITMCPIPGGGDASPVAGTPGVRSVPGGGDCLKVELPKEPPKEHPKEVDTHARIVAKLGGWRDTGSASVLDARARIAWVIVDDFETRGPVALADGGELDAEAFAEALAAEANRSGMLLATTRQGQNLAARILQRCRDEGLRPGEYGRGGEAVESASDWASRMMGGA